MKPMRKALVLALGALLMASAALCITACGQGASSGTASSSAASSDTANKTLVVYYSATATRPRSPRSS